MKITQDFSNLWNPLLDTETAMRVFGVTHVFLYHPSHVYACIDSMELQMLGIKP